MSSTGSITNCTVAGQDIKNIVNVLEYFESIYSPCASCNIKVNDAAGFNNGQGLKGGEDVEIGFGAAEGDSIRMKFKTISVGDRMRVKEGQDLMMMTCVPSEFVDNNKKEVVKGYAGKKISEMVKDWHEDLVKDSTTIKKDLATNEETEGNAAYHGTGRSPITAIRWAAKEGKSSEAKASNYVFYQDREGYHFRTVDKMLSEGGEGDTLTYSHQNTGQGGDPKKVIIAFDQAKDFDKMQSSYNGASSDHWYYYDPTTGKIDATDKGKRDGAGDTTHTGKAQVEEKQSKSDRGQRFNFVVAPGQSESKFRDSRDPKIKEQRRSLADHAAQSSAAMQLDNLVMNIRVPGDTKYKPGVKVRLNIPANKEEGELDKRSGSFLITSVRHVVYRDDKDTKYECVLECKSDSQNKNSTAGAGGVE
jgi:hypothetical protein